MDLSNFTEFFINTNVIDISLITNHINLYRYNHNSSNTRYNSTIEKYSQNWCNYLFQNNMFEHSQSSLYGENLYFSMGMGTNGTLNVINAINDWYDENIYYNYSKNNFQKGSGHFSALVWGDSQRYGIGYVSDGIKNIVCMNTWPPGNIDNLYTGNVLPPF